MAYYTPIKSKLAVDVNYSLTYWRLLTNYLLLKSIKVLGKTYKQHIKILPSTNFILTVFMPCAQQYYIILNFIIDLNVNKKGNEK